MTIQARTRRLHRRWTTRLEVEFGPRGGATARAVTGNVSGSGLYLEAPGAEEPGTALEVRIRLPGGEALEMRGIVVWATEPGATGPTGFGVWLLDPPEAWRRYCAARPAMSNM